MFGKESPIVADRRARTAQTPGGTGGLRVAADFIANQTSAKRIWISNPSWPNHKNVFSAVGLEVLEYAYYDAANHVLDFDGLLNSLKQAQAGDVVLFHGCCHNPTGIDQRRSSGRSWPNFPSPTAGCRCSTSLIRASPMDWKRMRRACVFSPPNIKS